MYDISNMYVTHALAGCIYISYLSVALYKPEAKQP